MLREKRAQLGYVSTPHPHTNEEPVTLASYSEVQCPTQCFGFYSPRLCSCHCSSQQPQRRLCSSFLHLKQLCRGRISQWDQPHTPRENISSDSSVNELISMALTSNQAPLKLNAAQKHPQAGTAGCLSAGRTQTQTLGDADLRSSCYMRILIFRAN